MTELNIVFGDKTTRSQDLKNKFLSIFLKNPKYVIKDSQILIWEKEVIYNKKGEFHFFIYGEIFDCNDIINFLYTSLIQRSKNNSWLSKLNGSFVIFIINETSDEILLVTDRINFKRIFLFKDGDINILTTNPNYFRKIDEELNLGGIASYLINGVVYNNNTLYKKIRVLERACLHTFIDKNYVQEVYWKYEFTNEYVNLPKNELRKKFANLLMNSVNKRIQFIKPELYFLSLSGGYDSRFLLGALMRLSDRIKLRTFSYGMINKLAMGDDLIASQLANKFNMQHHFEPAYENNLIKTIALNAKLGHGLSNFCTEIGAWLNLNNRFTENPNSILFVGDMYYLPSYNFKRINDKRILLFYSSVFPWQYLKPLLALIPEDKQEELIISYKALYQNMIERLPATNDFQILKDFAYLDQRISHTLMYWRDFFHAPYIKVTQPLLDNEILDFIRKLPNELRWNKIFYKETIEEMFPELFEVPIAKNIWANPSWNDEIERNKDKLIDIIRNTESKLDSIIPSEAIISLIKNDDKVDLKFRVSKGIGIARKLSRQSDILNKLFGDIIIKHTHVKRNQLIIRLLLLREVLQK